MRKATQNHPDGYSGPEPRIVRDHLIRRGGTTLSGIAIYRMVLASQVFEKKGGTWCDWGPEIAPSDRGLMVAGSDGNPVESARPIRVVKEVREIPKYSEMEVQGWILERWFPSEMFISREAWYERCVEGTSIPLMGPYPEVGQYDLICGPFLEIPSFSFIEDQIAFWSSRTEELLKEDIGSYVKRRAYEAEQREEKRVLKTAQENEAVLRDKMSFLLSTTELAGKMRSDLAERAGIRSHMGN